LIFPLSKHSRDYTLLEDDTCLQDRGQQEIEEDFESAVECSHISNEHKEGVVGASVGLLQSATLNSNLKPNAL
jgi:hypothetical protein